MEETFNRFFVCLKVGHYCNSSDSYCNLFESVAGFYVFEEFGVFIQAKYPRNVPIYGYHRSYIFS